MKLVIAAVTAAIWSGTAIAEEELDLACTIRSNGVNVNCTVMGKEKRIMNAEDIAQFIDVAERGTVYVVMKSPSAVDRVFKIDGTAPQFKKYQQIKKSGSISEVSDAKLALFSEIEKKMIKTAEELDKRASEAELVLFDSGWTYEKHRNQMRVMNAELVGYRENKEKVCTTTPAFEQVTKTKSHLEKTLSNLIFAFQSPDSCMAEFHVFKDREGGIDLAQLNSASDYYKSNCRMRK